MIFSWLRAFRLPNRQGHKRLLLLHPAAVVHRGRQLFFQQVPPPAWLFLPKPVPLRFLSFGRHFPPQFALLPFPGLQVGRVGLNPRFVQLFPEGWQARRLEAPGWKNMAALRW